MTDADLDKLEAMANRCTSGDPWYKEGDLCGRQTFDQFIPQDRAFIAAASPATILDLIASARRDAEEIERLRKAVTDLEGVREAAFRQGWRTGFTGAMKGGSVPDEDSDFKIYVAPPISLVEG